MASKIKDWVEAIIIAALLALFIRTFVVQAFKIPSGSMLETLQIGDHLLVSKYSYDVRLPRLLASGNQTGTWFNQLLETVYGPVLFTMGDPERGDVIVFEYPEDPSKDFIKRIIGLPGETLQVIDKQVYIDGRPLDEPYKQHLSPNIINGPRDNFGPVTIPEGHYFCMGDNRDDSRDSRFWGFVSREAIVGKALFLYWSWDLSEMDIRWDCILDVVH